MRKPTVAAGLATRGRHGAARTGAGRRDRAGPSSATIAAGFTYLPASPSLVAGLVARAFILGHIGARRYGLWLASGDRSAYAGLADLGVLVTLPWLVAEADGRGIVRLRHLVGARRRRVLLSWSRLCRARRLHGFPCRLCCTSGPASARTSLGPLLGVATSGHRSAAAGVLSALAGLQDVWFNGVAACELADRLHHYRPDAARGFGLYALAWPLSCRPSSAAVWTYLACW